MRAALFTIHVQNFGRAVKNLERPSLRHASKARILSVKFAAREWHQRCFLRFERPSFLPTQNVRPAFVEAPAAGVTGYGFREAVE
jgi:hypothetical protein